MNDAVLQKILAENSFEVQSVDSAFAAGVVAERLKPQIIFWEIAADSQNLGRIPNDIRITANLPKTKVVALTNGWQERELEDYGFDASLNLALDESKMSSFITELLSVAKQRVVGNLR